MQGVTLFTGLDGRLEMYNFQIQKTGQWVKELTQDHVKIRFKTVQSEQPKQQGGKQNFLQKC